MNQAYNFQIIKSYKNEQNPFIMHIYQELYWINVNSISRVLLVSLDWMTPIKIIATTIGSYLNEKNYAPYYHLPQTFLLCKQLVDII